MSEQNILNPTAQSVLNPDYSIPESEPRTIARWQARSGKPSMKRALARGQSFTLTWGNRQFSVFQQLRQWFFQYEQGFFTFWDGDRGRYFSGMFDDEPKFERVGNDRVNITATFIVVPGLPMYQYPSAWGADSIFLEERNDFGSDLVKLTGTWDRGDKNYALWSEQIDNATWSKNLCTVTANSVTDPNGNATADAVTFSGTGASANILQAVTLSAVPLGGRTMRWSLWMKAAAGTPSLSLVLEDQSGNVAGSTSFPLTTAWQRKDVGGAMLASATSVQIFASTPSAAVTFHLWGAQLEFAGAPTTYATATNAPSLLSAPASDANFHGTGFAYFNAGTSLTDAAEWRYLGYGFRVWSYKGPDMGIMQIAVDGVVLGTVDLYAAAPTASAVVFTSQNQVLAEHRVTLSPTNTKNASSTAFKICADAIEVMR